MFESLHSDQLTFPNNPPHRKHVCRGMAEGAWSLRTTQLRDFANDKHRTVDDTPSGGGAGLVLKPDILARAIDSVSPKPLPQSIAPLAYSASDVLTCAQPVAASCAAALAAAPAASLEQSADLPLPFARSG